MPVVLVNAAVGALYLRQRHRHRDGSVVEVEDLAENSQAGYAEMLERCR